MSQTSPSPLSPATPPKLKVEAGVDVSVEFERASVGSRGAAYIADLIVLVLVWLIIVLAVGLTIPLAEMGTTVLVVGVLGWFVTQWLYFGVQEVAMNGQTLGKKLVGIRVVDATGQPPGVGAALLRNVLRTIDNLPYTYGVGTLLVGSTEQSRRVGDILAGTHVVHDVNDEVEVPRFRVPPGATEAERLLLEQWVLRRDVLAADANERVAGRLVAWLDKRWPGFVPPAPFPSARLIAALGLVEP